MSEKSLVTVRVDETLHEAVKQNTDHGEISDRLRDELRDIAYGGEVSERMRLQQQLEDRREERRNVDADIQRKKHTRDELDKKITRLEEKLSELEDLNGKYDGMLESIESQLHEGVRFPPGGPPIQRAASVIDGDGGGVIRDLKERNPGVPDAAFREARRDEPPRWTEQ